MIFKIVELNKRLPNNDVAHQVFIDGVRILGHYSYTQAETAICLIGVQDGDIIIDEYQSSGESTVRTGKKFWEDYNK